MKLSKEELKKKIDEVIEDDDLKIALLEDIEDSMDIVEEGEKVEKSVYDELMTQYEELKEKYKNRFLAPEDVPEEKEVEETEEKEEVIDVEEIFENKEEE